MSWNKERLIENLTRNSSEMLVAAGGFVPERFEEEKRSFMDHFVRCSPQLKNCPYPESV
jgi:translation initiation factor 2 beta subunit (eIF-2beta)/eIF-5